MDQKRSTRAAEGLLFGLGFVFPGLLHWVMYYRVSAVCFVVFALAMWIYGGGAAGVAAHVLVFADAIRRLHAAEKSTDHSGHGSIMAR